LLKDSDRRGAALGLEIVFAVSILNGAGIESSCAFLLLPPKFDKSIEGCETFL